MTTLRNILAASAVLVIAFPAAGHAAVDTHVVAAETAAVRLSVFEDIVGASVLDLGGTSVSTVSDPLALATVEAASVLAQLNLSEAMTARSTGERQSAVAGDGCSLPASLPGFQVSILCASAVADAADAAIDQAAHAELGLSTIAVDGSFIAGLLAQKLDVLVEGLLDVAGNTLVAELTATLDAACQSVLDAVDVPEVPELVGELLDLTGVDLDDAREALETEAEDDPDCLQLLDLSAGELTEALIDITPILDALAEAQLVTLTLSDSSSDIAGADAALRGVATQTLVAIGGPSLDFLDDLLVAAVEAALAAVVGELEALTGTDVVAPLDVPGALAEVLSQLPLLDDDAPLLSALVTGGSAVATLGVDEAGATASGTKPSVTLTISPAILALFGADPALSTITVEAGETRTLAARTPLESTISVGDVVVDENATHEATGLAGATSRSSATTASLLTGLEGGVVLSVGEASAGAYGALVQPNPAPNAKGKALPNTGGGAAIAAVLALGSGLRLRRRDRTDA